MLFLRYPGERENCKNSENQMPIKISAIQYMSKTFRPIMFAYMTMWAEFD